MKKILSSTIELDKIGNVLVYFAERFNGVGKMMLMKLLYFADFQHYREIGKSISGLEYKAWKSGPVSVLLYHELKPQKKLFDEYVIVNQAPNNNALNIVPRMVFKGDAFTEKELSVLSQIVHKYYHETGTSLKNLSHKTLPFLNAYNESDQTHNKTIKYSDVLTEQKDVYFMGDAIPPEYIEIDKMFDEISDAYFAI